jgi:hypothetical protein
VTDAANFANFTSLLPARYTVNRSLDSGAALTHTERGPRNAPAPEEGKVEKMTGTPNQIELAEQIRPLVDAEFSRVAKAFSETAARQTGQDRVDTFEILRILETKRAQVLADPQAGIFIRDWRELNDQVRRMLLRDPEYVAIRAGRDLRRAAKPSGGEAVGR